MKCIDAQNVRKRLNVYERQWNERNVQRMQAHTDTHSRHAFHFANAKCSWIIEWSTKWPKNLWCWKIYDTETVLQLKPRFSPSVHNIVIRILFVSMIIYLSVCSGGKPNLLGTIKSQDIFRIAPPPAFRCLFIETTSENYYHTLAKSFNWTKMKKQQQRINSKNQLFIAICKHFIWRARFATIFRHKNITFQ